MSMGELRGLLERDVEVAEAAQRLRDLADELERGSVEHVVLVTTRVDRSAKAFISVRSGRAVTELLAAMDAAQDGVATAAREAANDRPGVDSAREGP